MFSKAFGTRVRDRAGRVCADGANVYQLCTNALRALRDVPSSLPLYAFEITWLAVHDADKIYDDIGGL